MHQSSHMSLLVAAYKKASVGISDLSDGPEEDHWVVGSRYTVTPLH